MRLPATVSPPETKMKILLADDHPLFREGVKPVLEKLDDQTLIYEAYDFASAFAVAESTADLDLVLLDLNMPGIDGKSHITAIQLFRAAHPSLPVVVMSAAENPVEIQALLGNGVLGYITKASPPDLIRGALQLVLAGGIYIPPELNFSNMANLDGRRSGRKSQPQSLSSRQIEVLRALSKGYTNRQIAEELQISEGTTKVHLAAIFRLLDVNTRTEAIISAKHLGLGI